MKIYDVVIEDDMLIKGVKAISFVEMPAIESDFVALSKEEVQIELAEVDNEKRILMGAVLIPDKPIYRNGVPEGFYIRFSKDTIEKAQQNFFLSGFQNQSSLEHGKEILKDNFVFESWIVEDTEKDKSSIYKLNAPVGSWVVKMKINNNEIWEDYVKKGKVKGFSIEGFFKPVEAFEMSKKLTDEEKLERIINLLFT